MLGVLGQATFSGLLCRFVAGWSLCGMCVRPHSAVCFVCGFVTGWSLCVVCKDRPHSVVCSV